MGPGRFAQPHAVRGEVAPSQAQVEIVIGLLVVAIPLVALARRAEVPYPIALVLGGLALGFVPGLPSIQLNPDLVLLIFLPPLLYWEAITAPTDVMLANLAQIGISRSAASSPPRSSSP